MLSEKAKSRAQQRFFGMVRSAQKGEGSASPEVAKVAGEISKKDAKDFAKTKHKGLPEKVKEDVTIQDANGNDFLEVIDLIKPEPLKKENIKEDVGYKTFIKQAQDARERVKKRSEEKKKKDAQYLDRVKKGVKFYDKKGSGRIVKGKKVYN